MIALEIRFLSGRFHANPWHHAHNEGIAEWPPSPWRVLRALVAAAYDLDVVHVAQALLMKLNELPHYKVPAAREAHVRHYMPNTDAADHKKTKVFDSFIVVDGGAWNARPVIIAWPVELADDERELLSQLAARVGYLGRAESWSEIRVVDVAEAELNCTPNEDGDGPSTTLMTLEHPDELHRWAATQPEPEKQGGTDVPRAQWDVLTFSGARLRAEGWSRIPGTRLARYIFAHAPFTERVHKARFAVEPHRPTVARYAIRSAVYPRLTEALWIGERVRVALMSHTRDEHGNVSSVFAGHAGGLGDDHQHAFYLSSSEGIGDERRGFIDHITVSARMGFGSTELRALQRLRRVWGKDGHDLELVLLGVGHASDFGGIHAPCSRLVHESRIWTSVTPFVPTRFPKKTRDSIPDQIRRGCEQLGLPAPVEVEAVTASQPAWHEFRRHRRSGGGRRGPDHAFGARIVFAEPQRGPIAIGFGAHFGLGAFAAVDGAD
jgi:CRISPR-associated protein Csb2